MREILKFLKWFYLERTGDAFVKLKMSNPETTTNFPFTLMGEQRMAVKRLMFSCLLCLTQCLLSGRS